ncbi:MAG: nucleoside-diphosphate sugar epimerase/dehydratase [Bacteroidales bacterium]|nr:nucleoside-diphosphate sugar epimerase/dehydratase [Bacteroidales bacterium]MDD4209262.1 nucleoside-diphosphate sugar epimerase/dehydratase [Bacteroidales bacterium]
MKKLFFIPNKHKTIPSWVILVTDMIIVLLSIGLVLILRVNFKKPAEFELNQILTIFGVILCVRLIFFLLFKIHTSLLRYTGTKDITRIFAVNLFGSIIICIGNLIFFYLINKTFLVPFSIIILEFIISTFIIIFYRLFTKIIYFEFINTPKEKKDVIIYGAGELGFTTKRSIYQDISNKYNVIGFVDDDPKKVGKKIDNLTIYSFKELKKLLETKSIAHVIIAIKNFPLSKSSKVTEMCLEYKTKVLVVPPVDRWINGQLSFKQIKKIKIEEFLERDPIKLDENVIRKDLLNKTILITGAAGSIGSEIVHQVMKYDFKNLILIDNAESPMFYLELSLDDFYQRKPFVMYMGDICDAQFMESIFAKHKPDVVYHAAAYKHVPIMEKNPLQAIKVNVHGTKILADLSIKYEIKKFIMISTDKAVNPTNIMGASKRIAEIYVQSLGKKYNTCKFITTRFGNVLGSNGSIIPILKKQIDEGGPITITHPEITRYFMTISEACELVLHAGAMSNGSEIYIFDMGNSIKILDLAKKMVLLSGLELGRDIQITFTGLRPGEKLHEELLNNNENTIVTKHKKIKIAKVIEYDFDTINEHINTLINMIYIDNDFAVVNQMKQIVPEFKSQNSIYMTLDNGNEET